MVDAAPTELREGMSFIMSAQTHYTSLSLDGLCDAFQSLVADTQAMFGALNEQQLNWKPGTGRWSIAQCLDHLVTADALMLERASDALASPHRTMWQRAPLLPRMWGQLLIRSQAPETRRRFTAPTSAQPSASEIGMDVVARFVDQHRAASTWIRGLNEAGVARTIMISPFVRFITYSVADGLRIMVAHDHRHFNQALRVTQSPGYPKGRIL
jgi:hypothetical protein